MLADAERCLGAEDGIETVAAGKRRPAKGVLGRGAFGYGRSNHATWQSG